MPRRGGSGGVCISVCVYMCAHVCMHTCVEGSGQMGTGVSVTLGGLAGSVWSSSEYISSHVPLP